MVLIFNINFNKINFTIKLSNKILVKKIKINSFHNYTKTEIYFFQKKKLLKKIIYNSSSKTLNTLLYIKKFNKVIKFKIILIIKKITKNIIKSIVKGKTYSKYKKDLIKNNKLIQIILNIILLKKKLILV